MGQGSEFLNDLGRLLGVLGAALWVSYSSEFYIRVAAARSLMRAAPCPILRPVRAYTWRIPGEYLANTWESAQPPTAHQICKDGARRVWSAFGRRRVRSSCRNWRICSMLDARRERSASDTPRIGSSPRRQRT